MIHSSHSKSNHGRSAPGVKSGSVEALNNEASAQASALAEINQCRGAETEQGESSQRDGANATRPVANEVPSSADEQSIAGLLVENLAAQETESPSLGEKPADLTAELPTAGRQVVKVGDPAEFTRPRVSRLTAILVVAEQNKAKVAATNGYPWTIGQLSIDSPKSSKYGISVAAGLRVRGLERLGRGDLVEIEIGRGDTCFQLTGRASRSAVVYISKADWALAGVELHTPCHYVVLSVVSQSGGGEQP